METKAYPAYTPTIRRIRLFAKSGLRNRLTLEVFLSILRPVTRNLVLFEQSFRNAPGRRTRLGGFGSDDIGFVAD